ncbi:MAG: PAS domain-containing protein [Evtepia gabavorous]
MKRNRVYLPQSLPLPFSAEQLDPLPRLIAILESSFDGIFVTDAQARPIWCNHSYEVISGLTAQEVLGVPMGELVRRGTISHSATLEALAQGQAVTINQTFTTGKRAVVTSTPFTTKQTRFAWWSPTSGTSLSSSPSRRPWTTNAASPPAISRRSRSSGTSSSTPPSWWRRTRPP